VLFIIAAAAASAPHCPVGGSLVLDFLEIVGCAFTGFLYIAILATAVTSKTRRNPTLPGHPESAKPAGPERT
jgi:hypothetical protein